jgi:hypothetical protein
MVAARTPATTSTWSGRWTSSATWAALPSNLLEPVTSR